MTRPVPGPDATIVPLNLDVPAGAVDCHMHIFGPAARFPYWPGRDYTPPDCTMAMYAAMTQAVGIARTVVVQPSVYGTDNRCTEDAVRRFGRQGRGVAVLDAAVTAGELRRLDAVGFRGTRFNLLNAGGAKLDEMDRLAPRLAELGWHIQVFAQARRIAELAERLAGLPTEVVIDHIGLADPAGGLEQAGFQALLRLLEGGRAWVKISGAYRVDQGGNPWPAATPFATRLIQAAPERVVWGTDWPHPNVDAGAMPNDGDLMNLLGAWAGDAATLRRILVENPERLYGFA